MVHFHAPGFRPDAIALVVLLLCGWVAFFSSAQPASARDQVSWLPPVEAPVIDPFGAPKTIYSAGNRGLEFGLTDPTEIIAVADGVVTFVGMVAGVLYVTVKHAEGLVSTYGHLVSRSVVKGQRVAAGAVIGTAGVGFQLTAKLRDVYIDPAPLIDGLVKLSLALVDALPPMKGSRWSSLLDTGLAILSTAHDLTLVPQVLTFARNSIRWKNKECTHGDVALSSPGDGRILVQVAGLGSAAHEGSIGDLDATALGYDDIVGFSYAGGCTPKPFGDANSGVVSPIGDALTSSDYGPEDTFQDVNVSAQRLADLISDIAKKNPGRPIDIAAHSLGGVVSRRALEILAEGPDPLPVDVVVTIGSPHQGTDLATAATALSPFGPMSGILDAVLPLHDAESVRQLSEVGFSSLGPPKPPPEGVRVVAMAGAADVIVPAEHAVWAGAENTLIPTGIRGGLGTHGDLPGNPAASRELALAISGLPPACLSLQAMLYGAATGWAISAVEDRATLAFGLGMF